MYDVKTVPYGEKVSAPAAPEKAGWTFDGWLLNGAEFDFGTAITADITLTAKWTANSTEHTITFVDTNGTTIKSVTVLDGKDIDVAELPNAGTDQYYAASTEDWKKCFGVTKDETVTLTLCTNTEYSSSTGAIWINSASGVTSAQEKMNLQFCEDWRIVNDNAGQSQSSGKYLTVSGDICYFSFKYYLNAGQSTVLKIYVDDCLVKTLSIDNSAGTSPIPNKEVSLKQEFLAGQHTIQLEIAEGNCAITCLAVRQRPAATTAETTSVAQMQAILVETKENEV